MKLSLMHNYMVPADKVAIADIAAVLPPIQAPEVGLFNRSLAAGEEQDTQGGGCAGATGITR